MENKLTFKTLVKNESHGFTSFTVAACFFKCSQLPFWVLRGPHAPF